MEIEVELSRTIINETSDQQIIVLKERNGERTLPIVIGVVEIFAIDRRLKGIKPPRPMTHELMDSIIESLGAKIKKIVISDLREHTFFAEIHLVSDEKKFVIDSRPSDAIALSVVTKTPIYVNEKVFYLASE